MRLSLMFFLDIAVIAAYLPLLSLHLRRTLRFSELEVALVFSMGPIAALCGPVLVGWAADRLLSANRTLLLANLIRVVALCLAGSAHTFFEMLGAMALVGLTTSPSMVLCSTIAFRALSDPAAIGRHRVWGAVSWVLVLWLVGGFFRRFSGVEHQLEHTASTFFLGAGISGSVALLSLFLPQTPPATVFHHPFAFIRAFQLLRHRSFRALIGASLLGWSSMQLHFILQPLFFTDAHHGLGLDVAGTSVTSSLAQVFEVVLFPTLAFSIGRWGLRRVLIVGLLAWPVRFLVYAVGQPAALVIGIQVLHGLSVVFGTISAQVAVDKVAPRDARASSQALYITATAGLGSLSGQLLSALLLFWFSAPDGGHLWSRIFLVPLALGVFAVGLLVTGFHPNRAPMPDAAPDRA